MSALLVIRKESAPSTDKQIELVKSFADQAVIAIENARLFKECSERIRRSREALEQQTATARCCASSPARPANLQPVFEAMVETQRGISARSQVSHSVPVEDDALQRNRDESGAGIRRYLNLGPVADPAPGRRGQRRQHEAADPHRRHAGRAGLRRCATSAMLPRTVGTPNHTRVPMLREGEPIGAIVHLSPGGAPVHRQADRAGRQLSPHQAVIAIENMRLLSELANRCSSRRHRRCAQGHQPLDVRPQTVLETLVESAARLCEQSSALRIPEKGESLRLACDATDPHRRFHRGHACQPFRLGRRHVNGRAVLEGKTGSGRRHADPTATPVPPGR